VHQATRIELDDEARFVGWDILCLGRPANAEAFLPGSLEVSLEVRRDGTPLLIDRLRVAGGADLRGAAGLRGHAVVATLLAVPATADDVGQLRALEVGSHGALGVTLIDGLLVARLLADDTAVAKDTLRAAWEALRPRVAGRRACPPRIWST
jgi:urease accessory protein